ncbi:MAG: sigma-70 family RNA polymerase sigma factor [Oscillibacter sp.]|nr:sigma-70 family RNA polymerase sigma factor [Oscillibacter sp.]
MKAYGDTVYRLALCRLQNAADAEDVYQDVFLRLLEQRAGRWDEEHLKAWLIRTALNRCADLGRLRRRRGTLSLEEVPDMARPADEAAAELWDAVGRLPENLRTAVHLFYGEGYESGEIGALLGIPAATVRSRLRRARAELRDLLGGFDDEESVSRADGSHPYARRAE